MLFRSNWCYEQVPFDDNYFGTHQITNNVANASKAVKLPRDVYATGSSLAGIMQANYSSINAFLESQLNVDYRTINETEYVKNVAGYTALHTASKDAKTQAELDKWAGVYAKYYKDSKVIISSTFKVLPETAWTSTVTNNTINFSVYAKIELKQIFNDTYDIFGLISLYTSPLNKSILKSGTTLEGILTYTLVKCPDGTWKLGYGDMSPFTQLMPQFDLLNGVAPALKDSKRQDKFNYSWTRKDGVLWSRYDKTAIAK